MNLLKDVFRQVQWQTPNDLKCKSKPQKNVSMSTNTKFCLEMNNSMVSKQPLAMLFHSAYIIN